MLCILCIKNRDQTIDIFSEEGLTLHTCSIICKHFWIQPNENYVNERCICRSCWESLYSFHKFFKQVEAAHSDYVSAIKLELKKEDSEINPPPNEKSSSSDLHEITPPSQNLELKGDLKQSNDLELSISKTCITKPNTTCSNEDPESSSEWQGNQSEDNDEEDEINKQKDEKHKPSLKPPAKTGKKRGRPPKSSLKETTRKQISEEQVKKQKLSLEFDDIIQNHIKLTCNICMIVETSFFTLRKHFRSYHRQRGYASCCGKKFYSRTVLVDHINSHLNPDQFKCQKCSKVLADRRCLEVHMDMHIEENQRTHQCNQCNKSFSKEILLSRHMHTHIPEEERKFPCEECNKLFSSSLTLKAHINNVHQHMYGKICDQCGKSIRGKEAFQKHLLQHAGVPIPGEQCDKCGAKLKNKYCLKRHMNAKHADLNVPHVCIVCGKVAPNEPALQRHYYYVHKCERNHKCPMCEKAFKKASGLKEHMTTHTGEILYTCPHCPKTFNSNANMHSHRKKMHRKEWEENRGNLKQKI